jgi:DNA polymerase-1
MKNKYFNIIENLGGENVDDVLPSKRILVFDGLNLFFRNFAIMNMINTQGTHVGGLGGFFRSLGAMIRDIEPTEVYIIMDGEGSTHNRKNIIPEYKGNRNVTRITKHLVFNDLQDEEDSKIDQIVRVVQYLKLLPVKTLILEKVEADDVISFLSKNIELEENDKFFILSSDQDFLQLINNNVFVYRPMEKKLYNSKNVKEKFNVYPQNFLIYKTLIGDNSDNLPGVKGMGKGKIFKLFPKLLGPEIVDLKDIYDISAEKFEENLIYSRIVQNYKNLEKQYRIMDLGNPMILEEDEEYLKECIKEDPPKLQPDLFLSLYRQDELGGIIKNVEFWIQDVFKNLK